MPSTARGAVPRAGPRRHAAGRLGPWTLTMCATLLGPTLCGPSECGPSETGRSACGRPRGARAFGAPDPVADLAERARRALRQDGKDLQRVAEWADQNGLDRRADADWERVLALLEGAGASSAELETARRRLLYLKRGGEWVRDASSWALVRARPEDRPERAAQWIERRRREFEEPSGARHRELARAAAAAGLDAESRAQARRAVAHDPGDVLSRLALGEVPDPIEGFTTVAGRRRRAAAARAEAEVFRLLVTEASPTLLAEPSPRREAAGHYLSAWRLRGWRLDTDLPDEAGPACLGAVDVLARWFLARLGLPAGTPPLPGGGTFVVVGDATTYLAIVDAQSGLSRGERAFARGLGAFPFPRAAADAPWEVVAERPDATQAADVCTHYAMHFLLQARCGVTEREAWLYEGAAAYAALRVLGFHGSYCVRLEATSAGTFLGGYPDPSEWPERVYDLVASGRAEPFRTLFGASLNGLSPEMLLESWSIVRWLLEDRAEEGEAFLRARAEGDGTELALVRATGMTLADVEEAWKADVLALGGE